MATEIKRTMTMNWDGLHPHHHDENDDDFFEANNRVSAVVPMDLLAGTGSSGSSDEDEFEDPRMSFASVISTSSSEGGGAGPRVSTVGGAMQTLEDYDMWMTAPTTSVTERRKKLFQGMGLNSSRELLRLRTMALSRKFHEQNLQNKTSSSSSTSTSTSTSTASSTSTPPLPPTSKQSSSPTKKKESNGNGDGGGRVGDHDNEKGEKEQERQGNYLSPDTPLMLVRSRSDGDIDPFSVETKRRKEQLIGKVSKQRITRTSSTLSLYTRLCQLSCNPSPSTENGGGKNQNKNGSHPITGNVVQKRASRNSHGSDQLGAFFLIKNLDTGTEFIVKEFNEDGMWNRLSDLQTGKQLTMEEFEKSVGYSPVVKELMRRENVRRSLEDGGGGESIGGAGALDRKTSVNAYLSKSFRYSKRRGVSFLKNINRVAHSVTGLPYNVAEGRETTPVVHALPPIPESKVKSGDGGNSINHPEWVRVRSQGKGHKELTAMRFCQEIHAHQGSIWTIKFNSDGRYLASAGEDKKIHIWEVQECEIASLKPPDDLGSSTPLHPMACPSPDRGDRPPLSPDLSTLEKKRKGKSASRRGSAMPDYVQLPETVFALSNEPVCSFEGHLDDVLDLSWSSSKLLLLSSSMDKTVRLWDLETRACLKLFAHNDYVTCIQFNPVNDEYFISGSLDAKVRIWSVPGRRVVDWTDLHEMVTAASYTPDGQGAAVGSHKGNCRMYSITDGKLNQTSQFDIQNKKKPVAKKVTGFEFNAENPNEVLVTSADSRVRVYDGTEVVQKFRGFRNTSSQISASYSPDGKYALCASEDSNVYVWKRQEHRNTKTKTTIDTRSYEYFPCKDVSVAIPWPGSIKFEPPTIQLHHKRNSKRISAPSATASANGSPRKEEMKANKKHHLPPLPNNKKSTLSNEKMEDKDNNDDSNNSSNNNTESANNKDETNANESSKSENHLEGEKDPNSPEADPAKITRSTSVGDSFSSSSGGSIRYGDSPSISSNHAPSPSWSPGWSWFDSGGSHGSDTMQATAWGLVIVTAGLGGEIRAYQNFGLPLRVGRQSNLFRDLT